MALGFILCKEDTPTNTKNESENESVKLCFHFWLEKMVTFTKIDTRLNIYRQNKSPLQIVTMLRVNLEDIFLELGLCAL
jgi:hypothetical protein